MSATANGMAAPAHGLGAIAEDGNPAALSAYAARASGITYPASPGAWLRHKTGSKPFFTTGAADYGKGIEGVCDEQRNFVFLGKEHVTGRN